MYQTMYYTRDLNRPIYPSQWKGYAAPSSGRSGPSLGQVNLYDDLGGLLPSLSTTEKTALAAGAIGLAGWWFLRRKKRRKR